MGNRNRPPRSKNPLLVAAAAVSRAIDPKEPSRIAVIRLLGDALHALQESQLVADAVKARATAYTSRTAAPHEVVASRAHLDAGNRAKAAHEHGARVLFSTAVNALIKLPSRAGPLRRRAVDLINIAGKAAGPAVVMQAAENLRSHISGLKRLSWTDTEVGHFEVVCAILTLADVSSCAIAGREVARESIVFLLSQRVRQKCKRGDLAHAIAQIVQSFPPHAPPDDRLLDSMLECCLTAPAIKQGAAGIGSALLTALLAPHMVSRGPAPSDDIVSTCSKALNVAPTPTEKSMWALALARASVTARRSTTYQVRKYGTTEAGSKFPQRRAPVTGAQRFEKDPEEHNASVWVSDEIFEQSLHQVASATGLFEGRIDATVAIACVVRMWSQALPDSIPIILPRAFDRLMSDVSSLSAASALVDGLWLGLLKDLRPSQSSLVFEKLVPVLSESGLRLTLALHVCSILLAKFGRECIRESGLSLEYNLVTTDLISAIHSALASNFAHVRLAGVRLMAAIIHALPRTCSQFLTAVLQNLRIADLALATSPQRGRDMRSFEDLNCIEQELSSILGNAAALSVLIEQVTSGQRRVPAALVRQCAVDSIALLRPHQASQGADTHGPITACIRRRTGWGLIGALARGKRKDLFDGDKLSELLSLWKEELSYASHRGSGGGTLGLSSGQLSVSSTTEGQNGDPALDVDEVLAHASARSAALDTLACSLRNVPNLKLEQCAKALVGACAARIVASQANLNSPSQPGSLGMSVAAGGDGSTTDTVQGSGARRRSPSLLSKVLTSEASQLVQCVSLVPPTGAAAELCYFVAISLGEEAQNVVGEADAAHALSTGLTYTVSLNERGLLSDSAMTNRTLSLERLSTCTSKSSVPIVGPLSTSATGMENRRKKDLGEALQDVDRSWMFSFEGIEAPLAEYSLVHSAKAVAAVVAQDLSTSGSLIESLSAARLSPSLSAAVALEMTRRLSRSDLAEINRTLAMLQVLVRRSLGIPDGCLRSLSSQSKSGRLYTPNHCGDGICIDGGTIPGTLLNGLAVTHGWHGWVRKFSDEGALDSAPFHNFHTRAMGIVYGTRAVAAAAHRELGLTGGPVLWMGLMRKVISVVNENLDCSSPSQSVAVANAIATLGALLEGAPDSDGSFEHEQVPGNGLRNDDAIELDEMFDEAIDILADAIERGKADVRKAAALTLSNCSPRLASRSERLLSALLRAWAQDKGEFNPMGHFGRLYSETYVWTYCFRQAWGGMGVKSAGPRILFFCQDSCGRGSGSAALATGVAAVLSSCRLYWWELSDSCAFSATELLTELVQWTGGSAQKTRAAGLYGMTALWASKIDGARAKLISESDGSFFQSRSLSDSRKTELQVSAIVPIQSFSLKEPSRVSSAVGPFLDEILYEALAPSELGEFSSELQSAATAAISELLRGAGVEETCVNLPRLPEALFAAADDGSVEAQKLLHVLVQCDAKRRPRYWFGLCRAVCLNGDRLNYGRTKSVWDVSLDTKALSVKIAAEAVDQSVAACACRRKDGVDLSTRRVNHVCALGFLSKIADFSKQLFREDNSGVETSGEGCKIFERVAARIGNVGTEWGRRDRTLGLLSEIWDSTTSNAEGLLTDDAPHSVANAATMAITELLVASLRTRNVALIKQAESTLVSFLNKGTAQDLRKCLLYSDQGEEVSLHAVLALVSNYGRVASSLLAVSQASGGWSEAQAALTTKCSEKIGTTKRLLFALCGDFVSILRGSSLHLTATNGGVLTAGTVSDSQLQAAMAMYIAPIVLGAISCIGYDDRTSTSQSTNVWGNEESPGVRVAEDCNRYESLILASYVWLLKHEHEDASTSSRVSSFMSQGQEALSSVLTSDRKFTGQMREALISFAQWNKTQFLKFGYRFSQQKQFDPETGICILETMLSVLIASAVDSFGCLDESIHCVGIGLKGLANLISCLSTTRREQLAPFLAHALDAVFLIIRQKNARTAVISDDRNFQAGICNVVKAAVQATNEVRYFGELCFMKTQKIFRLGCREQWMPYVKLSIVVGAGLCDIIPELCLEALINMLVAPVVRCEDGVDDIGALRLCLACYGVQDFVTKVICDKFMDKQTGHVARSLLAYELASLGVSSHGGSFVPIALRCGIAAIRDEGANCAVTNKVGLVLYSIFLPKLVSMLPSNLDPSKGSPHGDAASSALYVAELAEREMVVLGSFAASLLTKERAIVEQFLRASESSAQTI